MSFFWCTGLFVNERKNLYVYVSENCLRVVIVIIIFILEGRMPPKRRKLANKIAVVLMKYPECKVALSTFNDLFCKQYGHHIKPKEFHCRDLTTLLNELTDVVEVGIGILFCSHCNLCDPIFLCIMPLIHGRLKKRGNVHSSQVARCAILKYMYKRIKTRMA